MGPPLNPAIADMDTPQPTRLWPVFRDLTHVFHGARWGFNSGTGQSFFR